MALQRPDELTALVLSSLSYVLVAASTGQDISMAMKKELRLSFNIIFADQSRYLDLIGFVSFSEVELLLVHLMSFLLFDRWRGLDDFKYF